MEKEDNVMIDHILHQNQNVVEDAQEELDTVEQLLAAAGV
jgi:hypothetical protein